MVSRSAGPHWGAIILGYIAGSLFGMFQLWAWLKGLTGRKTALAPAS